jgi:hypothetical protein
MRFSIIRTGIAAAATSIALVACGGHGIVPSQGSAPFSSFQTIDKKTNPCYTSAVQPSWIFKGSCDVTKLPTKGETIKLKAYMGITETVTLPANKGKDKTFAIVDAIGGKANDIEKWKGKAFPLISKSFKSVIYVEAINGFNDLTFTKGDLKFVATSKTKLPSTSCTLSALKPSGTKFSWSSTPLEASIKGNTITYTIPASEISVFFANGLPKGALFFNVACT